MLFEKQYPFSKLFFDEEDQLHVITSTAPGQSGHEIMKIGEGLIEFSDIDFTEYEAAFKITAAKLESLAKDDYDIYLQARKCIFDVAALLKGKHRYAHYYTVALLNKIVLSPVESLDDLETMWNQLLSCVVVLYNTMELKNFCFDALSFCLDSENLTMFSPAERLASFGYHYPDMVHFVLQTGFFITATKDGKCDYKLAKEINQNDNQDIQFVLEQLHKNKTGVSLLPHYFVETLDEMLTFELLEMLKRGYTVKCCRNCGRYFIQTDKRKRFYCSRKDENGRTCQQKGSKYAYSKQVENDPYLKKYKQIYEKTFSRFYRALYKTNDELSGKDMSNLDYKQWSGKAQSARKDYLAGEISGDDMLKIINTN